jgi:hypothetical integral membrane protein (TIGR02206 family)
LGSSDNLGATLPRGSILFDADHLAALVVIVVAAVLLVRLAHRNPARGERLRRGVALFLSAMVVAWPVEEMMRGREVIWSIFPLDLCTFNLIVSLVAVHTRRQRFFECMYFWSLGAFLAAVTPPIAEGFPSPRFFAYFALHGAMVCAWAVLVGALGMRPGRGAWLRAWAYMNLLAAGVLIVNLRFGQNYFFLLGKPAGGPTLLDAFGPWPIYLVTANATLGALFYLMQAACARSADAGSRGSAPSAPRGEPETVSSLGSRSVRDIG